MPLVKRSRKEKNASKADRSARLRTEASNCLAIAVREKTTAFTAQLIDEAVRLMQRSAELSRPGKPGR